MNTAGQEMENIAEKTVFGAVSDSSSGSSGSGLFGTVVSAAFLLLIGLLNLVVLAGIVRVFAAMRHGEYDEAELERQLANRGFFYRFFGRWMKPRPAQPQPLKRLLRAGDGQPRHGGGPLDSTSQSPCAPRVKKPWGRHLGCEGPRPPDASIGAGVREVHLARMARSASTTRCGRYDIETLSRQPITPS